MAAHLRSQELGEQLQRLKSASGRSYESIGRKTHLSKSAVHRYCTGASVPQEFAVVERIALACGANRGETALLHRLWLRAVAADDDAGEEALLPAGADGFGKALVVGLDRLSLHLAPGRRRHILAGAHPQQCPPVSVAEFQPALVAIDPQALVVGMPGRPAR